MKQVITSLWLHVSSIIVVVHSRDDEGVGGEPPKSVIIFLDDDVAVLPKQHSSLFCARATNDIGW